MQNLPIPASAMPPQVNAAPVTLDTVLASGPDSDAFSAVLARELTAKKIEPKPDTALSGAAISDGQPQSPGSDLIPSQTGPEPRLAASAQLALSPGTQSQYAFGDQSPIAVETPGQHLVGVAPGDQAAIPLNTLGQYTVGLSVSEPASSDQPTVPLKTPRQPMMGVSLSNQASDDRPTIPAQAPRQHLAGLSNSIHASGDQPTKPSKALSVALSTGTTAQPDFSQAALPAKAALESDNTADFAAPGKFLPPVAAEEKTSRSGTEAQVPQRLPEAAPSLQMTQLAHAAASPASASAPITQNLQLDTRVGAPGWNGELAQKVVWMATQQQQVAELRLNPPHLGPVEVALTVGNDQGAQQASIQFASPHLATREAIESALPRLREMMADSGIALGNVTVSADSFQQQAQAGRQERLLMKQTADIATTAAGLAGRTAVTFIRGEHSGLVDTFA